MANIRLPELDTTSVLNIVENNFKRVGLKAYAIRMIYIGEHCLPKDELIQQFQMTIDGVNSSYCELNVYGVLLVYDSYFVHILEGSEDTVHRQLRMLMQREKGWIKEMTQKDDDDELVAALAQEKAAAEAAEEGIAFVMQEPAPRVERKIFRRLKMLMVYHSISVLHFDKWRAFKARPPSLVGKLDVHGPLAAHMEQLNVCLDKLTKLRNLVKTTKEPLSFENLGPGDPKIEMLPEVTLLDLLLQSQHILNLHDILFMHRRVDDYQFYFEQVWPLPTHFTPRNLYKLKIDDSFVEPLPVMPWELVTKEAGEDEEREEQSGSDSSD